MTLKLKSARRILSFFGLFGRSWQRSCFEACAVGLARVERNGFAYD